jgi:RHS repeat-associated protein
VSGGSAPGITTYGYNKLNQLLKAAGGSTTTTYTYDADGNRITRSQGSATDTYSYDAENRLVALTKNTTGGSGTYAYQYDYRTRRISRTENGTTTAIVFSGGTSVREYSGSAGGTPVVQYIRGSDYGGGVGGILYTLRGGTPSYTHENRRGDVIAKTGASGSLTYQAQYEGFGNQVATTGSTLDRQKSNSKDTDPTNFVDEGFRYRDLETGSFLTRDPAGFVDGPNLYTYVRQNPWTGFDPEGLFSATDLIPNPVPDIEQASQGYSEAFSSTSTVGQRAFGLTEGLAFDLDAAVTLIPGEGAAEHAVEKVVVNEVKEEVEAGVKQQVKTAAENTAKTTGEQNENVVYRALREGEDPSKGLSAKSPGAGTQIGSHVNGKKDTSLISTTKDPDKALGKFNSGNGVVKIDLNKVDAKVTDASNGVGKGQVYSRTKSDKEVLIHHEDASKPAVPPEAITVIQNPKKE